MLSASLSLLPTTGLGHLAVLLAAALAHLLLPVPGLPLAVLAPLAVALRPLSAVFALPAGSLAGLRSLPTLLAGSFLAGSFLPGSFLPAPFLPAPLSTS